MVTAENIFETKAYYNHWMKELLLYEKELIIDMIKEGQRDAINECAEKARMYNESTGANNLIEIASTSGGAYHVDKQSILSLIENIK